MATKPTGTSGTLIIEDISGRVYYRIKCDSSLTYANGKSWSGKVNGKSVSGTFSINGKQTVTVGSWAVSTSQTVSFTMGDTDTQGLAGPTTITASIIRGSAPGAPGKPSVSSVTSTQATISWGASSGSVSEYGLNVSLYSDFRTILWGGWIGNVRSYRLPAGTLDAGKRYYVRARAKNSFGESSYSSVTSFWTVPVAPTGLSVFRVSDTQHNLSWTGDGHTVQRSTNSGDWQTIATLSGATVYTDTSTKGSSKYVYRVAAKAGDKTSAWSNSVTVYTTPSVPSGVSASRSGGNIVVDASGKPPYATSYDVRDGGTVVGSGVSLPWTHVGPDPLVTHQYTVRAKNGALSSAYSSPSPVVQLPAPPNAPTGLTPNGATSEFGKLVRFAWRHNPTDSSRQTEYEFRCRLVGQFIWATYSGTTAQYVDRQPTDQYGNAVTGDFEWQVRTKGVHADYSPWSAVATVSVIDQPGVAILTPDGVWDSALLTVDWSWFQAQDRPQSAWQLELLDASGTVVESLSGTGSVTTATLATRLTEGTWTVRVRAAAGDVWSEWADMTFTAEFVPPAPPMLTGEWVESEGGVDLHVTAGGVPGPVDVDDLVSGGRVILWDAMPDTDAVEITGSTAPATIRLTVERLQGESWELVVEGDTFLAPGGGSDDIRTMDWESVSWGDVVYRATAWSADGAAATTEIIVPARSPAIWLSGGPGFSQTARIMENPVIEITAGRARARKEFAGRTSPVTVSGEALQRVVAVSASTVDRDEAVASADALVALAQAEEPLHLVRDPDGHRVFGELSPIQLPREGSDWTPDGWASVWSLSFTLTEATE